jgi:D-3-phosphoglycerate dehydrogenase
VNGLFILAQTTRSCEPWSPSPGMCAKPILIFSCRRKLEKLSEEGIILLDYKPPTKTMADNVTNSTSTKAARDLFGLWFERALPVAFEPFLDGSARSIGSASATPENALSALSEAEGIIASAKIRYDGSLMDRAPRLRVISRTGIGYDNVVVPEATARGIAVCNAPDGPTVSTAEHAITLLLAVAKRIKRAERSLHSGEKIDFFNVHDGVELNGLNLGLVGLGRIGRRVAHVASALGMRVAAYDPYLSEKSAGNEGIRLVSSLDALLESADVVSIHVPLTNETRSLINAARIRQMKRGAILINTARGGIVDEQALLGALESGHLSGAGLDVFETEPPRPDHPLLCRHDVLCTPHIAGVTVASKERLWRTAIAQAIQVLKGERPTHLVNPEVWPQR